MAKKALLDVLEQTIGKYVKNLDAESLNVAVWSGKIELHSLELDVDSVNTQLDERAADAPNLAVPFKILSGHFESFQVDVPWAHITSRPVVLRARGLSIEVEPIDRNALQARDVAAAAADDEITRTAKLREAREALLDTTNKFRLQAYAVRKIALANEAEEDGSSSLNDKSAKSSFSSRLVRRILENIQIEIQDVHVTLSDDDGSAGVVLESLSLVTTDQAGVQVFVDRTAPNKRDSALSSAPDVADLSFLYKRLRIDGLGVYLDEDNFTNARRSLCAIDETDREESMGSSTLLDHSYILAPLSFEAKLRQADSNVCLEYAKYLLRSQLSSLSIILTRNQLDIARRISKVMSSRDVGPTPLFPEYRPVTKIKKGTTKEWWKYAVRCIGRMNGKRLWVEFFLAYKQRKAYIPLYKRQAHYLTCSWIKPLSAKEMDQLIEIEHDRSISIEGLMAWRNIADAQIDKEREKMEEKSKAKTKQSTSYYSYIFGSSTTVKKEKEEGASDSEAAHEDPPIQLSTFEMKELEDMAKADFSEGNLSKDAKLCDVQFVLDALKVDLVAYDLRHVASLEMGKVAVDFDAAMNGAFGFIFDLRDLEIFDRTTPNCLFPSVLRMIDKPTGSNHKGAFHFDLSKSSAGDQTVSLKIAPFEAVASRLMMKEMQQFFQEAPTVKRGSYGRKANPLLAQSISGSVDLYYDAEQGGSSRRFSSIAANGDAPKAAPSHHVSKYDLSSALIEAWKEKTEAKASWIIDIDIYAPVVLVPEVCNDPRANVLVFNLGHLQAKYGKYKPTAQIQGWFDNHPRAALTEATYDSGNIVIDDLTFGVQKARLLTAVSEKEGSKLRDSTVVDSPLMYPTGALIDFAIETIGSEGRDRFCIIGVIPTVSFEVSPSQVSRVVPVINTWKGIVGADTQGDGSDDVSESELEPTSPTSVNGLVSRLASPLVPEFEDGVLGAEEDAFPVFYTSVGLQDLALTLVDDGRKQAEAHLVSVYASVMQISDGASAVGLRMGWFWVLDWMENDFPRRQKLVAHSKLPKSADTFARSEDYDVLGELRKQGVFESDYTGSTELADISFESLSHVSTAPGKEFSFDDDDLAGTEIRNILDAKFHSLFVHWNPIAIKALTSLLNSFTTASDDDGVSEVGTLVSSPDKRGMWQRSRCVVEQPTEERPSQLLVRAQMESLDVVLNSARDDLPLYLLTVSGVKFCLLPRGRGSEVSLSLGDLRLSTPLDMGATLPNYRTLLGLASGTTKSLLTVKYCRGKDCILTADSPSTERDDLEAWAVVELSPMRMMYIQSQVMTLVDYITEGILGSITARAASTAAEAAKQLAESISGDSLYVIRATSLGLILPQAANKAELLKVHTALLNVEYLSGSVGSKIKVVLSDMSLTDSAETTLLEAPLHMSVNVALPAYGVGSLDEQAMRVDLDISIASFVLTKAQYMQIMHTVNENIGETILFLRGDEVPGWARWQEDITASTITLGEMTHAGNKYMKTVRRLCFVVTITELSVKLHVKDLADPLVRLAAVNARISMHQFPDLGSSSNKITLQKLVCEDCRILASKRQYKALFDQSGEGVDSELSSLFQVNYNSEEGKSEIELMVGSPQIVLVPDVISEITSFVSTGKPKHAPHRQPTRLLEDGLTLMEQKVVDVNSSQGGKGFETQLRSGSTFTTRISAKTGTCRFVFVDLGSQLTIDRGSITSTGSQLTETIVFQGIFACALSTESDLNSGKTVGADFQGQADRMELFTAFGREMKSPVQIVDPAEASVHGSLKTGGDVGTEVEVRAAALTPMDFSISMHDAALLIAIVNGLIESGTLAEERRENAVADEALTPKEQQRIEHLASALDKLQVDESINYHESGSSLDADSIASSSFHFSESKLPSTTKFQMKITMPQTRITVINDLQGLDEALFRVSVTNFVAGGEVISPKTLFDFHCNTSILADYFDSSVNLWSSLLTKPWEITMKGSRAPSRRFKSHRLSSTLDLESFPCHIGFSEQFLVSLASAARMWSIYRAAIRGPDDQQRKGTLKQSMSTTAARNLITSFPYAIANHCGIDASFTLESRSIEDSKVPAGSIQYFRFDPPKGDGYGGKRAYGQDAELQKLVAIDINDHSILVNVDAELGLPCYAHELGDNLVLFTKVIKEGKTTVLHLTSYVEIQNKTLLPFQVAVLEGDEAEEIGSCMAKNMVAENSTSSSPVDGLESKNTRSFSVPIPQLVGFSTEWQSYGQANLKLRIAPVLKEDDKNSKEWALRCTGTIHVNPSLLDLKRAPSGVIVTKSEVTCRSNEQLGRGVHPFTLSVALRMSLVADQYVCIDISLEPRAVIENKIPIPIKLRTPMPQTFSLAVSSTGEHHEVTYNLDPAERVEIFTPGPSIAVMFRTRDSPVAGLELGWLDGGWVDLPLLSEFSLVDPMIGMLPFQAHESPDGAPSFSTATGAEVFIAEGSEALLNLADASTSTAVETHSATASLLDIGKINDAGQQPLFFITVCNYGVDHTGNVLFEQIVTDEAGALSQLSSLWQSQSDMSGRRLSKRGEPASFLEEVDNFVDNLVDGSSKRRSATQPPPSPLGSFASPIHRRRITLLSSAKVPLRLLQMTMDGEEGLKRSLPFLIDDLPIGDGGASTVPIFGYDKMPTGHFAYRSLVNEHQSAIHIIPEFIVFNGSKNVVLVKERNMPEIIIEGGEVGQLRARPRSHGLEVSLNFIELECQTSLLQVGMLGLRVAMVKSYDGVAVGSVYVQTAIDTHGDSRLVVKVGGVRFGSHISPGHDVEKRFFSEDFCRFRVRWTELKLILNEVGEIQRERNVGRKFRSPRNQTSPRPTSPRVNSGGSSDRAIFANKVRKDAPNSLFNVQLAQSRTVEPVAQMVQQPIMALIFSRFTVDFQRVFKDSDKSTRRSILSSPERSQISIIVHNVLIKDLTPDSHFPMVFDCSSDISFFDLCVRARGPLDADFVKVDLFDLNLAHNNGRSEKMVLTTSEDYVWRILDLINRILAASGDVAGFELKFEEDDDHGGYIVKIEDSAKTRSKESQKYKYTAPKVDTLYDISLTRVSPFTVVVSFRRSPDMSRYKKNKNSVAGAGITNYFTRKLKFTIDKAELNFARYEDKTLKGPPDRLIETLSTVYVGRMKFKVVSLLSAASLQDWRYLAARDSGDDEYVEGDILRATGNLAGKSAGVVFKKVGQGFGGAMISLSSAIGNGIEDGTSKIGARQFGSGVSSVVNGVGHGVGDTVSGLGTGTGKLLQGAGQGVGHVFGGISGGALQVGKGIGKGITTGDGKAVVDGLSRGASSIGGGIAQGAESAVMGAADGFLTAGKGIFSGARSFGAGIGGALTGKKPSRFQRNGNSNNANQDGNA